MYGNNTSASRGSGRGEQRNSQTAKVGGMAKSGGAAKSKGNRPSMGLVFVPQYAVQRQIYKVAKPPDRLPLGPFVSHSDFLHDAA